MTKRALISVSDKAGIVEFAQELKKLGWDIISTGGTKVALDNAGVDTIAIDDVTGFPEMMDGRVKTLHPKVHGGILGRRGTDDAIMQQHGIEGDQRRRQELSALRQMQVAVHHPRAAGGTPLFPAQQNYCRKSSDGSLPLRITDPTRGKFRASSIFLRHCRSLHGVPEMPEALSGEN